MVRTQIASRIRAARQDSNYTIAHIAKSLSLSVSTISRWERGVQLPDYEMLAKYANLVQKPLPYFFVDDVNTGELVIDLVGTNRAVVGQLRLMLDQSVITTTWR